MLKEIQFTNYRCFRSARLQFTPLTALVGGNATGKTSILRSLAPEFVPSERDVWQRKPDASLLVRKDDGSGNPLVLQRTPTGAPGSYLLHSNGHVAPVRFAYLQLQLDRLRSDNRVKLADSLAGDGGNLANVLKSIGRQQGAAFAGAFRALVPVYEDVDVLPSIQEGHQRIVLRDRWNDAAEYLTNEVSDGTMLALAFLALQFQREPYDLVAIEEPERGLHPYLLADIVALLRKLAHGEITGKKTQVVIATHSPGLLDAVNREEVRFLTRSAADGSVTIHEAPADNEAWRRAIDAYEGSLGGMWMSGGLGGVPGA